jgi:hypothetical protein
LDLEHGGDLDIHAQSISKISSGGRIARPLNIGAIRLALGLACTILLVLLFKLWGAELIVSHGRRS